MRTRVVFGRGGPRGPPKTPHYLSLSPPVLPFGIESILSGNRFKVLASIHEKIDTELSPTQDDELNFTYKEDSVVRKKRVPNSILQHFSPKDQPLQLSPAPDFQNHDSRTTYTTIVRGRPKSQFFHKKAKKSSKRFVQKLKESLLPLPDSQKPKMDETFTPSKVSTVDVDRGQEQVTATITPVKDVDMCSDDDIYSTGGPTSDDLTPPDDIMDASEQFDDDPNEFHLTEEEKKEFFTDDINPPPSKKTSLQSSLATATIQPNIKRFFSTTNTTNIPSVPKVPTNVATNVGTFTSVANTTRPELQKNMSSYPTISDQNTDVQKVPVQSVSKREITCRFKIRIEGGTCNLPLLVKQVVKLYRGVDPSLTVLPIENPEDDSLILDSEDSIPETESALKKWVTSVIPYHERVHFTMRFSLIKTLNVISGPIFSWMKLNRSYVKMDTIRSEKIVTLGFFEGFHPDFQSRDKFKKYCLNHIKSKTTDLSSFSASDFSIYPRAVYVGSTMDKVTTRAMVIEVGVNQSNPVLLALSSTFSDMYSKVTFIPFTKMNEEYQVILKMAMLKQNKFLHTLKRKQIKGLINPHQMLKKKDGQDTSLCQWLQSARNETGPDSQLIQSVEETRYNTTSILYHENNSALVMSLCQNLRSNMEEHFPSSALDVVFTDTYSPTPLTVSRVITDTESTWANIIKRKYLPNPQEGNPPPQMTHSLPPSKFRKSVYYGTTKTPSSLREDTHVQVDKIPDSASISTVNSELSLKCNALEKQVQALIKSQEQQSRDTRTYVDESIATMEENLNVQIQNNTNSLQQQISTMETTNNNQLSTLAQTLNAVAGNVNLLLSSFNLNGSPTMNGESTATNAHMLADGSGKH